MAMVVTKKWCPKHFDKYLDATIVSLPLMYSVSKLSCIYAGCCHGFEYVGPFAYVHDGGSYFPVQLTEVICFAAIYLISLKVYFSKEKKKIPWLPFISLGTKFMLDFCRAERAGLWFLSKNQLMLLIIVALWVAYLVKYKKLAKSTTRI